MHQNRVAGVAAPPPLIFLSFLLLASILQKLCPLPMGWPNVGLRLCAILLAGAAFSLALGALGWFRHRGTDPRPWKPSTTLVVEGPYRWTRNPMYLAMTLLFLSWGLWHDSCWCLVLLPGLIEVVNRGIIFREESYLATRFGPAYLDYRKRVRRWL